MLRNLLSIVLLGVFAIFHFGYYAYYYTMKHNLESYWKKEVFTEHYNKGALQSLKVPINFPYGADQETWQTTFTAFTLNGERYRAVKQRYFQDSLEILYVVDQHHITLNQSFQTWMTLLAHQPLSNKGQSGLLHFITKNFVHHDSLLSLRPSYQVLEASLSPIKSEFWSSPSLLPENPPPQS